MFRKSILVHLGCSVCLLLFMSASWGSDKLFQVPQSYYSGGGAASIAVADVNGDGKLDLLVANGGVGVLLGNGDGTFQVAQTYDSGGQGSSSIAAADVNGDGRLDVIVANECLSSDDCSGIVGVLLGNGNGTFQAVQTYHSGGSWAGGVATADVNGDGNLDLLLANGCPSNDNCPNGIVSVLLGNGDGTFRTAQTYSSGALNALSIVVGDVNRDGRPDLLVASYLGSDCLGRCHGRASVLLGNGDGTFQAAQTYDSGGYFAWSIALEDVNGDGRPDLIVANLFVSDKSRNRGVLGVLLGNGDGSFQAARTHGSGGYEPYSIATGDVNGDGNADLLVGNYCLSQACPAGGMGVVLGNGDGTFGSVQRYGSGGDGASSIAVGDVNGDGKLDVLVGNQTGGVGVLLARYTTTSNLSSSLNPSNYRQAVTFTVTVTSAGSTPTGRVKFMDGATIIGSATLSGGVAKLTKSNLAVGTHPITAQYVGDAVSLKSTSAVLDQVVK